MKTYEAVYMPEGMLCWDKVTEAELSNHQWVVSDHIRAFAQVCWNENALHVRLRAVEKDILCRFNGHTDEVCKDSCLEFFFSPEADGRYLNLESNPNGAMYFGVRFDRFQYLRLINPQLRELLQMQPFVTADGWGVEYCLPVSLLQLLFPGITLTAGKEMTANFYKCGAETKLPHYLTWNKVDLPKPDYHQPAFFGKLILK